MNHDKNNLPKKLTILYKIYDWISSWRFAVFFISFLIFFIILIFSILLIPPVDTNPIGKFAKSFRIWCFGLNPETQKDQNIYLLMFILDPLLLIVLISLFWFKPLKEILNHKTKEFYKYILYGFIPVFFSSLFFLYLAFFENPTFSYDLNSLRIHVPLKSIELIDHRGNKINLNNYKGKVLIITSFYSHCHYMCPVILKQVKDITSQIKDKSQIKVFAITMDPERDSIERLNTTANIFDMNEPYYHFLTGDKIKVNHYLDHLNFARQYIPETGAYNHANIILIIDKKNNISYRFTINGEQKSLAIQAIHLLMKE
ncbi:MAG: hypothetical protein KatS3mg129_2925 [Leptospiraceae bacterium]|nr:MAG: hypothetical protein KatS3mg129_2925 [Leptospiraceae bacterium]